MLLDPDHVADRIFVGLVMGVELVVRRTVFFSTGCVKRRSTLTTTVLSCLSLTTTPCNLRFGISGPLVLRSLSSGARRVFRRAMSRRT